MIHADDRRTRPASPSPLRKGDEQPGPAKPDVKKPGADNELMKRMRNVDPDQARKYRQRSGE